MHSNLTIEFDGSFFFFGFIWKHIYSIQNMNYVHSNREVRNPRSVGVHAKNDGLDDDTLLFPHSHIIRFCLSLWNKCQFDELPLTLLLCYTHTHTHLYTNAKDLAYLIVSFEWPPVH